MFRIIAAFIAFVLVACDRDAPTQPTGGAGKANCPLCEYLGDSKYTIPDGVTVPENEPDSTATDPSQDESPDTVTDPSQDESPENIDPPQIDPPQNYALSTPPPTWVFAGDVPNSERIELQEEMEAARAFFAERYGVEATDFTVLVATDNEALAPVFRDATGMDLGYDYPIWSRHSGGEEPAALPLPFVEIANNGRGVVVLTYGKHAFSTLKEAIVHEYFHVLQNDLAPSTKFDAPFWMVEGTAMYAEYVYSQSGPDRRPFFDMYSPYRDLGEAINEFEIMTPSELERLDSVEAFRSGKLHIIYTYAMAFAGLYFLVEQAEEDSYLRYWELLNDRPPNQAFEDAFGIGLEDFYGAFEEWLPSQLPSQVQLSVLLRWPGKEAPDPRASVAPVFPKTNPVDVNMGWMWGGMDMINGNGVHTIIASASAEDSLAIYLALERWSLDECTVYTLGWYKDGGWTDQFTEATLVEFSGPTSIEWTLPAHPDELPPLAEQPTMLCAP